MPPWYISTDCPSTNSFSYPQLTNGTTVQVATPLIKKGSDICVGIGVGIGTSSIFSAPRFILFVHQRDAACCWVLLTVVGGDLVVKISRTRWHHLLLHLTFFFGTLCNCLSHVKQAVLVSPSPLHRCRLQPALRNIAFHILQRQSFMVHPSIHSINQINYILPSNQMLSIKNFLWIKFNQHIYHPLPTLVDLMQGPSPSINLRHIFSIQLARKRNTSPRSRPPLDSLIPIHELLIGSSIKINHELGYEMLSAVVMCFKWSLAARSSGASNFDF